MDKQTDLYTDTQTHKQQPPNSFCWPLKGMTHSIHTPLSEVPKQNQTKKSNQKTINPGAYNNKYR